MTRRGSPKAIVLSVADYIKLAAPEPEILRAVGEESKRKGTDRLSMRLRYTCFTSLI